jgi:ABC-type proline/glycine betaine transport system permease subunit
VTTPRSSRSDGRRFVLAAIAALVGLVWVLQGLGVPIGRGLMVGDPFWALAGGALVVAALAYAFWPRLRRR